MADFNKDIEIDGKVTAKEFVGSNKSGGVFNGVFDVSKNGNTFYDDYLSGGVVNLSLSATKVIGSMSTVNILGSLIGAIAPAFTSKLTGDEINTSALKINELTVVYVSDTDVRMVNRVFNIPDTEAPTQPTNLASNNIQSDSFGLTWDASTDNVGVVGYNIYLDAVFNKFVAINAGNIDSLSESTSYSVTVEAVDGSGNVSILSSVLNVNTTAANQNPSQPTNLASSNITGGGFDLTWDASTDPDGTVDSYNVFVDSVLNQNVPSNSASVTGLSGGTAYSVTVQAVDNDSNVSPLSSALSVSTSAGDPISILPNLHVWLDGSDSSEMTLVNTDELTQITDKADNFTFNSVSGNPIYDTDKITFAETGYLQATTSSSLLLPGQDFHGYLVFKMSSLTESSFIINSASSSSRFAIGIRNGRLAVGSYDGSFVSKSTPFTDQLSDHKLEFKQISGVVTMILDGSTITQEDTVFTSNTEIFSICGYGVSNQKAGDIKDFFVTSGEMTAQQKSACEIYINNKHGV